LRVTFNESTLSSRITVFRQQLSLPVLDPMRHHQSLGSIHVVFFSILDGTVMAYVSPRAGHPSQVLSSGSVLSATAAFSTFSANNIMIHNQGLSSFQPSDSGTPTTSSDYVNSNTSTSTKSGVIGRLPLAGPLVAGILVGIILIAAIVVICFLQRRPKRPRRRRRSFDTQCVLQPDSHPRHHSRNRFLHDEISSENDPPKKKHHHYSHPRYSSGTMELDIRSSAPQIMEDESLLPLGNRQRHSRSGSINSIFSMTLNTTNIGADKTNPEVIDGKQTSSTLVSDLEPVSSNKVEPSPSQIKPLHTHNRNKPALPPGVGRQHLNALIQQRAALTASENTSDKGVYSELLHLEEQIQILRRQDVSPLQENPPPYEAHR